MIHTNVEVILFWIDVMTSHDKSLFNIELNLSYLFTLKPYQLKFLDKIALIKTC